MLSKAKKQAALLEQQRAREAKEAANYFPLLMKTLELATSEVGCPLVVRNGKFCLEVQLPWGKVAKYEFPDNYSPDSQFNLDDCSRQLESIVEARKEEVRKAQVKRDALAKLTDEERALLGL